MPKISPALPPAHPELAQGTLDERIALAEQRLVAREQVWRHRTQAFLQRAQEATAPGRFVRPTLYALGALALAWGALRLLRRRSGSEASGHPAAPAAVLAAPPVSRIGELPWVRAAALLWPLLPVAWRGQMKPETASILVAMALPLIGWLFRRRARGTMPKRAE